MECEQQIAFSIYSDNKDCLLELSEFDTVGKYISVPKQYLIIPTCNAFKGF